MYISVDGPRFEWDPSKARTNRRKHGVTFEEAASAFADEWGLIMPDPDHSTDDDRFVLLGLGTRLRLLVVAHAFLGREDVIRIISARKATPVEARTYLNRR